jgi:hypothetical protein
MLVWNSRFARTVIGSELRTDSEEMSALGQKQTCAVQ